MSALITQKNILYQIMKIYDDKERGNNDITLYGFLVQSLYHLIFDMKKIVGKNYQIKNQMI